MYIAFPYRQREDWEKVRGQKEKKVKAELNK